MDPQAGLIVGPGGALALARVIFETVTPGEGSGKCFRCGIDVAGVIEIAYLDASGRNDCPESADGMPHEIDAPEGWED